MSSVLALLVFAIYPGTVEAIIINDDSPQVHRASRDPFLFKAVLSRGGLNIDACGLTPDQADANYVLNSEVQVGEYAANGVGLNNGAYTSADRLFRDGDSRLGFELNGFSSDARLLNSTIPILGQIETRMANIGNCLSYMQYLLKTIGVIFDFNRGNFNAVSDRDVVSNPYLFVFMSAGRAAASNSSAAWAASPAKVVSPSQTMSKYGPKFEIGNTLTTMLHENRSKLFKSSSGRAGVSLYNSRRAVASNSKKRVKRRPGSINDTLKNFVIKVFSQPYIYILVIVVFGFDLFLRRRA